MPCFQRPMKNGVRIGQLTKVSPVKKTIMFDIRRGPAFIKQKRAGNFKERPWIKKLRNKHVGIRVNADIEVGKFRITFCGNYFEWESNLGSEKE